MKFTDTIKQLVAPKEADNFLSRFPNKVGSYGYDAWGFNVNGVKPFVGIGRFIFENYFRVESHGLENIPPSGRVLIIANHSGQLPVDAMLLGYSIVTNPYAPRAPKGMYERFVPQVPFISTIFSQWGGTLGDPENCEKMLFNEEAVIVFPEGAKGISKPWKKRYQLQHFGNGFIHMALKCKTPVIPVGIVGAEEIMINLGNIDILQKITRFPAFPALIPFFFPSKVIINFGKPMFFEGNNEREYVMSEMAEQVKHEVKKLMDLGLAQRKGVFS